MTIQAQLHDGRVLEFPDGTDPAVVQSTVRKLLGVSEGQPGIGSEAATRPPTDPARMSLNEFGTPLASSLFGQGQETAPRHPRAIEPGKPFGILPLTQDQQGGVHFDINAGLPGALIRAVRAPYDAMTGQFDPMSPEGQKRALETALAISPGSAATRAGERLVPGLATTTRRDAAKVPTAEELKATAGSQYDAARNTGAQYPGQAIGNAIADTQRAMESDGFIAEIAPQTFSVIRRLQNPPEGSFVTIQSLDAARKILGRIAGNFQNPTEQAAARRAIERIDQIIADGTRGAGNAAPGAGGGPFLPPPAGGQGAANGAGLGGGMAADPAQMEAARLIKDARGNAAANFRSDRITGKAETAEDRAAAANSGRNIGNTLRQRLTDILASDNLSRGYSPEELAAMREVVRGTASSNTLRYVGNLLGGGGGVGQTLLATLGAAAGGQAGGVPGAILGASIPLVGVGSRAGYNALARRQVNKLDELVRKRSPLYQQRTATAPLLPMRSDQATGLLLRGLLLGQPGGLLDDSQY